MMHAMFGIVIIILAMLFPMRSSAQTADENCLHSTICSDVGKRGGSTLGVKSGVLAPVIPTIDLVSTPNPQKILAQYLWLSRKQDTAKMAFTEVKTNGPDNNSRTVGPKLFDNEGKPIAPLARKCATVGFSFENVNFEKIRGKTFYLHVQKQPREDPRDQLTSTPFTVPQSYGERDEKGHVKGIPVKVCNGLGELAFDASEWREWIDPKRSFLRIYPVDSPERWVYPPKYRQWIETCVKSPTSRFDCGRDWEGGNGELYELLNSRDDRSRFHITASE